VKERFEDDYLTYILKNVVWWSGKVILTQMIFSSEKTWLIQYF